MLYSEATAALSDFADGLGIPVCETQAGKGALPWNHAWNAGGDRLRTAVWPPIAWHSRPTW